MSGEGGHSSRADQLPHPIAKLARIAVAIDDWGQKMLSVGPAGFRGMCTNVADLRGGVAFNIVPTRAELLWSLRPPPGTTLESVKAEMAALIPAGVTMKATLENPTFATRDVEAFRSLLRFDAPVDLAFWTEAAMLSAAGVNTVVYGPGDIAVAHGPDELVPLEQLEGARAAFVEMFRGSV